MKKARVRTWFTIEEIRSNCSINQLTSCWNWQGATDRKGYAQARRNGKLWILSRVVLSWADPTFDINSGRKVCACHHCDNTRCLNPVHLFAGTYANNIKDKMCKGRQYQGDQHWKCKIPSVDIPEIFRLKRQGLSNAAIGRRFKVGREAIRAILIGINRKSVSP